MKNKTPNTLQLTIMGPSKGFESIKKVDENGVEYWTARELQVVLGYRRWEFFDETVSRAMRSALNSGQIAEDHFRRLTKMVKLGSDSVRKIKDWKLDRYACYLVAQNGDPTKPEIALAQTYFAVQTRKQEVFSSLSETEKRIQKRQEVADKNKILFSTARLAGVSHFGLFNDAGYKGLYSMSLPEIETRKHVPKGQLLDHAGSEELGANMFRITQTEASLKRENIRGDLDSRRTHFDVGKRVRQVMKELGSEMPENLKPERHIKELKRGTAQKRLK
jgi:DNA-damage-inducible protein D